MMTQEPSYLGLGLYTIAEAAKILQLPVEKLRRWAKGYYYSTQDSQRQESSALLRHEYPELSEQGIITFIEMIELYLIAKFREYGVSMQMIRKVASRIASRHQTNHPFAVMGLRTDGRIIIGEMGQANEKEHSDHYLEELHNCQIVFDIAEQFLYPRVDFDGELINRFWPIGKDKGIICDPHRNFGQPIIDKNRVPTYPLYKMSIAGETPETIAWWYNIDVKSVQAAIEFEQLMAA